MKLSVNIKSISYKSAPVLKNLCFSIENHGLVAVLGRNGVGKSTLIGAISALVAYDGEVKLDGVDVRSHTRRSLAKKISAIPQIPKAPHITVRELVSYGRSPYLKLGERLNDTDMRIIDEAIEKAEIADLADSYADRISGGELRRAWFAMLLAQNTEIALLDEATAFMDADYENKFLSMAKSLAGEKIVIAVTHNLDAAVRYADSVLLIYGGEQVFFGTAEELLSTDLIERTFSVKRYLADGKIFFRAD